MKVQWPLLLSLFSLLSCSLSLRGGCVWPWPKPFQRPRRRRHATAAVATPKVQCPFARLSSSLLPSLPCFFPLLAAAILLLSSLFFSFAQALNCFDPSSSRTSKNYVSLTFFNWLTEQFFHDTSMKERLKLLSKGQ